MKLGSDIGIRSVCTWLPETRESVKDEIESGRLDAAAADRLGAVELPVSTELAAPEMAVLAGLKVLARANCAPASVGVLLHSWIYHQGRDKWSPSHYVANGLGLPPSALVTGVHELCNGGMSALHFAASSLLADPKTSAALVTTADRFGAPVWDRWRLHTDISYGDGATAALLHRLDGGPDELRLHSLTHATASWLEALDRGNAPFTAAPMEGRPTLSAVEARREFYEVHGRESLSAEAVARVGDSLQEALEEAGISPDDPRIRLVATPRVGPRLIGAMYEKALDRSLLAKTVLLGGRTGHLGAGDMLANMADIVEQRMLNPGEYAVVLGCGSGFAWSTAVVQAL
ncbi:3-oxoacyl-ACP synthase [Streptomyces sp. SID10853]|uniref:ketoacyl-ACP synthase III family protein n=1 Tax=Streptomyces sp. SID10853 TaxID=2706028 RepID=UPI0013BF5293|nr:ketoacyl-ACP synthase III family protein [Streptomyces sp. SID10853]NDZ79364.1 3-oxoacyl-ACP synthase [Streptomyces sp. SID10853]